ncbi:hypothetical protein DFH07DRAFT_780347 [Mycena maculata]|uniref:Uncharacterized protein n=1 Tax=Mycena maculata TaxID=230809 RepID=A0AAD7I3M1_9AGAR|nr:hypothetical protein DFH07DRAFT_780347 [Mycena maculata]
MALMARLQSPQGSAAAVPENFPATPPPLIPRFASRSRRKDRAVRQVFRSSGNRVPTLPLQLAPSPQLEQLNALDPTDDDSVTRITDIVQQVLAGMGIVQVTVQEESKKKKKHGPSKMAAAVKKQQAELAPEQDQIYKNGLRELWRVTNGIDTANGFKNYTPADSKRVEICNDGGDGPDPSDYSLDFGDGYASSLWNKAIIGKLVKGFQRARAASGGWGLPEVSDTYLEGELYGQLKRSQQAWALWRPRLLPALLRMETETEAIQRAEGYLGRRQSSTTDLACRRAKFTWRIETVKKIVLMKSHKGDPDLATWKFFKTMLEYLDVAGMSEEDSEVRILCEKPVNTFTVRLCAWRAPPIADYLRLIDETGQTLKKTNAAPRIRDGGVGTSPAPEGLPRKMYDEAWLSNQPASYIEDLNISAEVFEFLVAATSSISACSEYADSLGLDKPVWDAGGVRLRREHQRAQGAHRDHHPAHFEGLEARLRRKVADKKLNWATTGKGTNLTDEVPSDAAGINSRLHACFKSTHFPESRVSDCGSELVSKPWNPPPNYGTAALFRAGPAATRPLHGDGNGNKANKARGLENCRCRPEN